MPKSTSSPPAVADCSPAREHAAVSLNPLSSAALLIEGWVRRRDDPAGPPSRVTRATGFLVDSAHAGHVLVTARHVLSGEDMTTGHYTTKPEYLTVRLPPAPDGDPPPLLVELYDDYPTETGRLWVEHPRGREVDVAAVPLPVPLPADATVVVLDHAPPPLTASAFWLPENGPAPEPSSAVALRVTDRLFVVGWPYGDTGSWPHAVWSTGYISTEPDIDWNGLPAFLLDCRSRQGQSGAPVLLHLRPTDTVMLADGDTLHHGATVTRLVGVYSGRVDASSDLGRVFTTAAVRDVLAQLHPHADSTTAP